jgi:hypothetical protein
MTNKANVQKRLLEHETPIAAVPDDFIALIGSSNLPERIREALKAASPIRLVTYSTAVEFVRERHDPLPKLILF